jgi:hypothetical protein
MRILKTPEPLLSWRREWNRKWREKNPEKSRSYSRRYYARNVEKRKAWRVANRESTAWYFIKRKYGLTPEAYVTLLQRQNNVCGICQTPKSERKLVVDHDHLDGHVRGLLCHACNSMLAVLENEPFRKAASEYTSGVKFIFPLPHVEIVELT